MGTTAAPDTGCLPPTAVPQSPFLPVILGDTCCKLGTAVVARALLLGKGMCLQSGLSSATSPWCGLKVTLQGERKCHDGDLARRHRHSQGHIPGLSPHAPLAHWPGSHTGPLIAPLPVSPRAAGHPWCPFPWFPVCSSSCVLGEQCGCPCSLCMTTGPVSPDSSHVCLPELPAAAALPACFQLSADDSRDCSTVLSNPGLPAVGVPMGYVARLLEQPDRQLWCALCPMCPMCSMCSMCASVCHGVPWCAI